MSLGQRLRGWQARGEPILMMFRQAAVNFRVRQAYTPNQGSSIANQATPTAQLVAAARLTPVLTGRLQCRFQLSYTVSGADQTAMSLAWYDGVTSITGGAASGQGITTANVVNAPLVITATSNSIQIASITNPAGAVTNTIWGMGIVQATAGHDTAIAMVLGSGTGKNYTSMLCWISVVEMLNGGPTS